MSGLRHGISLFATLITIGLIRLPRVKHGARLACHQAARLLLRLQSQPYQSDDEPVTVVIAPHPDDETLGCGGLIASKRLQGLPVHVIYITDGGTSHPDHPAITQDQLASLREQEARRALAILGVETPAIHFLRARDGTLAWLGAGEAETLAARLRILLNTLSPDEVFTPLRWDGSSEHEATFKLLTRALAGVRHAPRLYEYPVWSWWNPLLLIRPILQSGMVVRHTFTGYEDLKRSALAAYESQTLPTPPSPEAVLSPRFIKLFSRPEEFFFEV